MTRPHGHIGGFTVARRIPAIIAAAVSLCLGAAVTESAAAPERKPAAKKTRPSVHFAKGEAALRRNDGEGALAAFLEGWNNSDPESANAAGQLLYGGHLVTRNRRRACALFDQAAHAGTVTAMHNLATCYYKGDAGKQDDKLSVKWFRRAVDRGYKPSLCALGTMYFNGRGVAQNKKKGFSLCLAGAKAGNANAQTDVAQSYLIGRGVARDPKAATSWLRRAAKQRHANANHLLGLLYLKGNGVARSFTRGRALLFAAAKYGNRRSPYVLGQLYYSATKRKDRKAVVDAVTGHAMLWMAIAAKVDPMLKNRREAANVHRTLYEKAPHLHDAFHKAMMGWRNRRWN